MKTKLLLIGLIFSQVISGQKIFHGAVGYGSHSRGAYAGSTTPTILTVDTLYAGFLQTGQNSGSFEWCLKQKFPRIIVFSVGGTIDYTGIPVYVTHLRIDNGYCNVYGQTAPYPGITVKSSYIYIHTANNILIQNLKIRPGDDTTGVDQDEADGVSIVTSKNIVFDHCTFSWCVDDLAGAGAVGSDSVTFSNCLFYEALDKSHHHSDIPEAHAMGIFSAGNSHVTVYKSLIAYVRDRMTYCRNTGDYQIINNFYYSPTYTVGATFGESGQIITASYIGNVSLFPPQWNYSYSHYSCRIKKGTSTDSKIHVKDNLCQRKIDNPGYSDWSCVRNQSNISGNQDNSPHDLSDFDILNSQNVENAVLLHSGCIYRDAIDEGLVNKITNREPSVLLNSQDSLPARCYNIINQSPYQSDGDMTNGYDWSVDNQQFDVNGKTIYLTADCKNIREVMTHIGDQLPEGTEVFKCYGVNYIGIKGTKVGDTNTLVITENKTLGLWAGTYFGSNGSATGGYVEQPKTKHQLDIPVNPHDDDNSDGYTNIEEWAYEFSNYIDPVNHSPNILPQTFFITDNISQGTLIGKIQASDPDYGQSLSYSIIGGNSNNRYSINSATGNLTLNQPINISSDVIDNIVIQVMDNGEGNLTSSATISCNIQHYVYTEPNNSPVINNQVFNIADTLISNSSVGKISASDPDNNQTLSFSILSGNTNNRYHINTGTGDLTLSSPVSINSNTTDELRVQVMDNGEGNLTASATITINIEHIDIIPPNHPPVIQNQSFSIDCPKNKGYIIGTLPATDPDNDQTLTYSIISTDIESLFSINSATGEIVLEKDIYIEDSTEYRLEIRVTDNAPVSLSSSAIAYITIYPERKVYYIDPDNDNDPQENGSYAHPYNSWNDVTWVEGYSYLQKRGTTVSEKKISIGSGGVTLGCYGEGNIPTINSISTDFAIRILEKSNITIKDLHIFAPDAISCIYIIGSSCDSNIIQNCILEESGNGVRTIDGKKITLKYNKFNNMVEGIYSFTENTEVYYNLFKGSLTAVNISGYTCEADIYNNVFYDNSEGVSASYANLKLHNNIFYLANTGDIAINHRLDRLISDYNIFYPEYDGFIRIADNKYSNLHDYKDRVGADKHSLSDDPLFIDVYNGDFNVLSQSPAIDAGIFVGLTKDYSGSVVPFGNAPDIGLSELQENLATMFNDGSMTNEDNSTHIYPNPSNGTFYVKTSQPYSIIRVFNTTGIIVQEINNVNEGNEDVFINILDQPKGTYIIQIFIDGEIHTKSMIII